MGNEIVDSASSPMLVYPNAVESPWFDFIQGVIGSLAWPLVIVLAILLFHKQILGILPDLDTLKLPGAEMSFKKRVAAVVEQAKEIDIPAKEDAEANAPRQTELSNLATYAPVEAILQAWNDLDKAAKELMGTFETIQPEDLVDDLKKRPWRSARVIATMDILPPAERKTYEELRKLRNRAVHEGKISQAEALSYLQVADQLTDVIRGLDRTMKITINKPTYG